MFEAKNKGKKWNVDTKGFKYLKLREYLDANGWESVITVFGYYINHLKNGDAVTIITDNCFINMPSHAVEVFAGMTKEEDDAIREGLLILKDFKELDTEYNNKTIVFEYADAN